MSEEENIGMSSRSFYSSSSKFKTNSQNYNSQTPTFNALKRKLNSACDKVRKNRTEDLILSEIKCARKNANKIKSTTSTITITKNLLSECIPLQYRVFKKQCQALEFCSNFEVFRVFAVELDGQGRRHFITCHPQMFWKLLKAKPPDSRFAYEVIGENMPSKLYFDLEYKIAINPHVDGQNMLNKFKDILKYDLLNDTSFPYEIEKVEILDLDSSTADKFSHHLIVNLYDIESDPVLFLNNLQVGNYVRQFISRLLTSSRFGDNDDLSKFPNFKLSDDKIFVDEAVYSKNRNFRTFLSSKFGKKSVLKKTNFSYDDEKFFYKTLVTYNVEKMERKKLIKFDLATLSYKKIDPKKEAADQRKKRSPNVNSSSPESANKSAFPEIDIYIENLVKKDNSDGYIRKVQTSPCGWFLTYEFGNYRTCRNVGRPHKSNNVKLVVDLKANKVGQTCHDPDCKDFSSEQWNLPESCIIPWQELLNNDENDQIPENDDIDSLMLQIDEKKSLNRELVQDKADDDEIDAIMLSIEDEDSQDRFLREISRELP